MEPSLHCLASGCVRSVPSSGLVIWLASIVQTITLIKLDLFRLDRVVDLIKQVGITVASIERADLRQSKSSEGIVIV